MTKEEVINRIVKAFAGEANINFTKIKEDSVYVELNSKTFKVHNNNLMVEEVENEIFLCSSKDAKFVECKINKE